MLKSISVSKDHHQYLKKAKNLEIQRPGKKTATATAKTVVHKKKTSLRRIGKCKHTRSTVHQKRAVVKTEQ